jgi:hypothetical protein
MSPEVNGFGFGLSDPASALGENKRNRPQESAEIPASLISSTKQALSGDCYMPLSAWLRLLGLVVPTKSRRASPWGRGMGGEVAVHRATSFLWLYEYRCDRGRMRAFPDDYFGRDFAIANRVCSVLELGRKLQVPGSCPTHTCHSAQPQLFVSDTDPYPFCFGCLLPSNPQHTSQWHLNFATAHCTRAIAPPLQDPRHSQHTPM